MIRTMGDATGSNAYTIPKTVQLVAPYITGVSGVPWSQAALEYWAGVPQATIDQGSGNAPRYDAKVIDIETGAYSVDHVANWLNSASDPDPTIYVNRSNVAAAAAMALTSRRFHGAVWLSYPGWQPGQALPPLPDGCRYVAIQNQLDVNSQFDLSAVIDDNWMPVTERIDDMFIVWGAVNAYLISGGKTHHIADNAELACYAGVPGQNGASGPRLSAAAEAALLADFPPGNPAVTVNAAGTFTGTFQP